MQFFNICGHPFRLTHEEKREGKRLELSALYEVVNGTGCEAQTRLDGFINYLSAKYQADPILIRGMLK